MTLDVPLGASQLLMFIVRAVFSSTWSCSRVDVEEQKNCKGLSERPFSVPSHSNLLGLVPQATMLCPWVSLPISHGTGLKQPVSD